MLKLERNSLYRKWINFLLKFVTLRLRGVNLKRKTYFGTRAEIGAGTRINTGFKCKGIGALSIGKYCALGENIRALTANHNLELINLQVHLNKKLELEYSDLKRKDIRIGNNVWIGDQVILLPGVRIGDGAIIGAGAVVTKDVEPYSVNAGNPSRFIKYRYSDQEVRQILDTVKWWEWPEEKMIRNREFFELDYSSITADDLRSVLSRIDG